MTGTAFLVVVLLVAVPLFVHAEDYSINVSRKDRNLYKVEGKDIYVYTRMRLELALSEKAFLSMSGYQGEITFTQSGSKCDVKGVYGQSDQSAGDYRVRVSEEADDWYEVSGTNMFIRTNGCMSMAMGKEATLSIGAGGYGSININGRKCTVEGVYGRMSL